MVRAAYFHLTSPEQGAADLEQLRLAGVNTALMADGSYQIDVSLWQQWGSRAEQQGLSVFPVINFAVPAELRSTPGGYRPYINRRGQAYLRTPCPLDDTYWEQVIGRRFEQFAALAGTRGLVGAVFDTEMYGSDISLYTDLCYCDACWQEFLASSSASKQLAVADQPAAGKLPSAQRFAYLAEHDLLPLYTTVAWQRLQQILRPIVERLHQIQPAFQVGFLCYRHNWFYTALVQGLGTPEVPVLVFSESSYVLGYTPYVDQEREQVQGQAQHARYVPGLWLSRYFPQDLPAQLTDLAFHTDGYWLYTADSLWQDDLPRKSEPIHGNSPAYWIALQQANQELLRLSQISSGARAIAPVRQASFYDRSQQRLHTTPALHAVFNDLSNRQRTSSSQPAPTGFANLSGLNRSAEYSTPPATYRGETLFHCRVPRGGGVRLIHVPIGAATHPELVRSSGNTAEPLIYTLFNDVGDVLQTGPVTTEQPVTLSSFLTRPDRLLSILIESGINGVQVELAQGGICVLEASSTFPLETFETEQTYHFAVPSGITRIPFRAHCPPRQAADITVRAPDQGISQTATIASFTEFQVDVPLLAAHTFWQISVAPASETTFGDVRWHFYDYEYPYVIVE